MDDLFDKENFKNSHYHRKYRYVHQHFPEEIAIQKMEEYFRQLPFVESVSFKSHGMLNIKMKNGKEKIVSVRRPSPDSILLKPLTQKDIIDKLERARNRFEERLKRTIAFFSLPMARNYPLGR